MILAFYFRGCRHFIIRERKQRFAVTLKTIRVVHAQIPAVGNGCRFAILQRVVRWEVVIFGFPVADTAGKGAGSHRLQQCGVGQRLQRQHRLSGRVSGRFGYCVIDGALSGFSLSIGMETNNKL